jgi:hypothetical protein
MLSRVDLFASAQSMTDEAIVGSGEASTESPLIASTYLT